MSATAFQRLRREQSEREAKGKSSGIPSDPNNDETFQLHAGERVVTAETTSDSLEDKKVPELKEIAKGLNVEGADGMKKAELIAAIQAAGDAE